MEIREVDPRRDEIWSTLVDEAESDVFHSPAWLRVLANTYDFEPRAVVALQDGRPVAGVPFCRVEGLKGVRNASLPFSDYCDPLVETSEQWEQLVEPILSEGIPYTMRPLHNDLALGDQRFRRTGEAKWHAVDLSEEADEIWSGLSSSARRAVRKAGRESVELRHAESVKDLREFFELHLRVRKYRHGLLAQPFRFFESIFDEFLSEEEGTLLLASRDGEVVAGVLYLEWKDKLYYKFNAWDSDYSAARPNDAIMWAGVEYGKKRNLALLDLGLSDSDQEGLLRYKRKYASVEGDIAFLTSGDSEDAGSPVSMDFVPRVVDLFTRDEVPDEITERAGEILYPLFA